MNKDQKKLQILIEWKNEVIVISEQDRLKKCDIDNIDMWKMLT